MKREIVNRIETKRKNRSISRFELVLFRDVIMFFVNAQIKFRYDNKHKSLMLKVDDMIYLRFYKNYSLFNKFIKKLNNQYVEFFLVKQRINRLIYELDLFFTLYTYSIISII